MNTTFIDGLAIVFLISFFFLTIIIVAGALSWIAAITLIFIKELFEPSKTNHE